MRFKYLLLLAFLSFLAGLAGAWFSLRGRDFAVAMGNPAVRTVLSEYLYAWQAGNPEQMYKYLSSAEQQAQSQEEYVKEFNETPVSPLKFRIKDIKVVGNKAIAQVIIFWPNLELDGAEEHPETIVLKEEAGSWRIVEAESLK